MTTSPLPHNEHPLSIKATITLLRNVPYGIIIGIPTLRENTPDVCNSDGRLFSA